MKKILFLSFLLLTLFISSSQTYEQQSILPSLQRLLEDKPLEEQLEKLEIPYGDHNISIETKGYYGFIEFLIRKGAHFVIFGLVALGMYAILPKISLRYILALILTLLVACLDEYHQHLTGGRTPSLKDVILDMAGAFTFLSIHVTGKVLSKKIRLLPRKEG